jgi:Winged helix DNA-binding domain
MRSLCLSGDPLATPEQVVHWLGAVQSQDYGPAKWSVGQRTGGVTDAAVEKAFANGAILRTHVLRPTWHFVAPADIRWMLELTSPRVLQATSHYHRRQGLDDVTLSRCNGVLVAALQGGRQLTRKELAAALENAGISTNGLQLGLILMNAELNGIVCSGAPQGKQQTYALLDERAPQAKGLARDEALAELTLRYFTSHGPATVKDFRWWSGLTTADIKQGIEMAASQLEHEHVDGVSYWFAESDVDAEMASPSVHLVQGYDEYIVGYSESKYLLDVSGAARSFPRPRGIYTHAVILDSQVVGQWKRTTKKDALIVEVALFTRFDDAQMQALRGAAERHGAFLGLPATELKTEM